MQTLASQLSCINSCLTRGGCIKHNISFINLYRANSTIYSFQMRFTTMDRTIKIRRTNIIILNLRTKLIELDLSKKICLKILLKYIKIRDTPKI